MASLRRLSTGIAYKPIGAMNKKITIQSLNTTADDLGGLSNSTVFASSVWASIAALSGRELYKAQQVVAEVTHEVVIRYLAGVKANMSVLFNGRTFDIVDVSDPDEQRVELRLLCLERNDGTVGA